jgi:predicted membrane protein
MNNQNSNTSARLIAGLILIVLGGLFLLDNYGIIYFSLPSFLFHWEYILIAIGLFILATSNNKTAGIILIAIGVFNLFPEFWPLILVGLGIYIILKRNNAKPNLGTSRNMAEGETQNNFTSESSDTASASSLQDSIDDVSIFGGGTKNFSSKNFTGGKMTAIFGGSDVHLENCTLAHGRNELDLFVMFGGYEIFVPQDWNVVVDVIPIFGGFSDKRMKDPNRVYEDDKILVIKGMVLFGGGEVKF